MSNLPKRVRLEGNLYNTIIPKGAVAIVRPSIWGNPFKISSEMGRDEVIKKFELALTSGELRFSIEDVKSKLRGKNLACWCPVGESCHGDILIKFANS
jgi:hypothetical protein